MICPIPLAFCSLKWSFLSSLVNVFPWENAPYKLDFFFCLDAGDYFPGVYGAKTLRGLCRVIYLDLGY